MTRTISERALQDMIDGKLTPQQADRLIRAAVTTDSVLVKLLGTLKWGAIASLPFFRFLKTARELAWLQES